MFARFFKPRWQHANPDIRLSAVTLLAEHNEAQTLATLARGDSSALVRAAAAGHLADLNLLDEIALRDEAPSVKEAASLRIMSLLAGTCDLSPSLENRLRLIRLTNNNDVLFYIAQHSNDTPCIKAALEQISDERYLLNLALQLGSATLRTHAAQRIRGEDMLRLLVKEGRDKAVLQHARSSLKTLRDEQESNEKQSAEIVHLADTLEVHARRSFDALYEARLAQLEQQWSHHQDNATEVLYQRVQAALGSCRERIEAHQQQLAQEAAICDAQEEQRATIAMLDALKKEIDSETWNSRSGELRSAVATQVCRWEEASRIAPAGEWYAREYNNLSTCFDTLFQLFEAATMDDQQPDALAALRNQWPSDVPLPAVLAPTEPQPSKDTDLATAKAENAPSTANKKLIGSLRHALQRGNLRQANRLWRKATDTLETAPDSYLEAQLNKLSPRRAELQDWHRFAAEPKKVALCEQMEALQESTLSAESLAQTIHQLHDEWRALMSSDQDEDQALWERFKNASDDAYAPCQRHFAERDQARAENLAKREALVAQLQQYVSSINWDCVEWQALWEIRRQAPTDWKALSPVSFTAGRQVQRDFSALLTQIDEKLDDCFRAREADRAELIEQAKRLSAETPNNETIHAAQALQKRWQQAPWLPPAKHRNGAKAFRAAIDAVFKARDAQREAQKAKDQAKVADAKQHLTQVEALLETPLKQLDTKGLHEALQTTKALLAARIPSAVSQQLRQQERELNGALHRKTAHSEWEKVYALFAALPHADDESEEATALTIACEGLAGVPSPDSEHALRQQWQLSFLPIAMKRQGFSALNAIAEELKQAQCGLSPNCRSRIDAALQHLAPAPTKGKP